MPSVLGRLAPHLRAGRHRVRRSHIRGLLNVAALASFVVMAGMLHPIAGWGMTGLSLAVLSLALDDRPQRG